MIFYILVDLVWYILTDSNNPIIELFPRFQYFFQPNTIFSNFPSIMLKITMYTTSLIILCKAQDGILRYRSSSDPILQYS